MMKQFPLCSLVLVCLLVFGVVGCGGPEIIDVRPAFTVEGKPLAGASITFVRQKSDGGGRAAFGITDENGVATMTTYKPNDGVPPGKYSVVVIKAPEDPNTYETIDIDPTDTEALLKSSAMGNQRPKRRRQRVRSLLPTIYTDPGTTPLECQVDSDTEDLTFQVEAPKKR